MNLHKFIDELWENGSSNFNLCTGVMGEYSSQSFEVSHYNLAKEKEDIPKHLTKFIIENGYKLSLPEYSISGKYGDGMLILHLLV